MLGIVLRAVINHMTNFPSPGTGSHGTTYTKYDYPSTPASLGCDSGLPSTSSHSRQWICEHRDPYILNMVRFRKAVAGEPISAWWDNAANAIAFSRGAKGFVAINRETTAISQAVATTVADGNYCDLLTGGLIGKVCAGTVVAVKGGNVSFTLPADHAIAIGITDRL